MNLLIIVILFLIIIIVAVRKNVKQSIIYFLLWIVGASNLIFNADLKPMFNRLFPPTEFGKIGELFGAIFFGFACVTLAHQAFLYYYLHDLETEPQKWEVSYPKFYGSTFEKTVRILAFVFLLLSVDEIPFIKKYISFYCAGNKCSDIQNIVVCSSTLLFFLLAAYDIVAGCWCKKWKEPEHWFHTGGDVIAFIFWLLIAWKVIITHQDTMGVYGFLPIIFGAAYIVFFVVRVGRSIYFLQVK